MLPNRSGKYNLAGGVQSTDFSRVLVVKETPTEVGTLTTATVYPKIPFTLFHTFLSFEGGSALRLSFLFEFFISGDGLGDGDGDGVGVGETVAEGFAALPGSTPRHQRAASTPEPRIAMT